MPMKSRRPCSMGCGRPAEPGGKCIECRARQRRHTDQRRGSSTERGYGSDHEQQFRNAVLERDGYRCVDCGMFSLSNHADHDPYERAELIEMGCDPNDPRWGVTRCQKHHSSKTRKTRGYSGLQRD